MVEAHTLSFAALILAPCVFVYVVFEVLEYLDQRGDE